MTMPNGGAFKPGGSLIWGADFPCDWGQSRETGAFMRLPDIAASAGLVG